MGQVLTNQRRRDGSREEETLLRLSALAREKILTGSSDASYWVLLAEKSTDRFVVLERIHETCWYAACNDEFELVAAGNAASEDGWAVFWEAARDLARVVHAIMRKIVYTTAAYCSKILEESATRGLLIYQLDGCEAKLKIPDELEEEFTLEAQMWRLVASSLPTLGLEKQMLSQVLKPPSVLAAASQLLLSRDLLRDTASSSSAPLALVPLGRYNNPSEATGYEHRVVVMDSSVGTHNMIMTTGDGNNTGGHNRRNLLQELAGVPPHVFTAAIEFLVRRRWWHNYVLEAQRRRLDYDMVVGGQSHQLGHLLATTTDAVDGTQRSGAATPVQEGLEVGVMVQAYAAFLPACVTAYPLLKDVPDYVKLAIFGGLAFTTVSLFVGILAKSVARRRLAMRLVSFLAIAVLTLSVASQISSPSYIALTAVVGVVANLIIVLLRF